MCQVRTTEPSAARCASDSRVSGVRDCRNALPYGLSGPIGTRSASTSSTALRTPSTVMSSRAENRCWWYGAPSPGATSVAYSLPPRGRPR